MASHHRRVAYTGIQSEGGRLKDHPPTLDDGIVSYDEQGFVHWICPLGHYFKNQLFDDMLSTCPHCDSPAEQRSYHETREDS